MTKTQHTETPYTIEDKTQIVKGNRLVANAGGWSTNYDDSRSVNEANARFIVKTCNNHDALVGALKDIYAYANSSPDMTPTATQMIMAKCWLVLCNLDKDGE